MTPYTTPENVARTSKGNTQPKEVWVTFWDIYNGERTYLDGVDDKPWEPTYNAPITEYADNVRYVPGSDYDALAAWVAELEADCGKYFNAGARYMAELEADCGKYFNAGARYMAEAADEISRRVAAEAKLAEVEAYRAADARIIAKTAHYAVKWKARAEAAEARLAERDAEIARLTDALTDMWAGWRYIRMIHGDLPGVGWDRCDGKARAALEGEKK